MVRDPLDTVRFMLDQVTPSPAHYSLHRRNFIFWFALRNNSKRRYRAVPPASRSTISIFMGFGLHSNA